MGWSLGRRVCAFAGFFCLAPGDSRAGAWLTEASRTQLIFTAKALDVRRQFIGDGSTIRTGRFIKQEIKIEAEHGLNRDFALLAGVRGVGARLPPEAGTMYVGVAAIRAGAKARLWSNADAVISLQGWAEASRSLSYPERIKSWSGPVEGEIRLNGGLSGGSRGWPIFLEAQLAYRWRGSWPNEAHLDLTAGVYASPRVLFLLQSFNAVAVTQLDGTRLRRHKLQPSVVYAFSDSFSLQLGVFATVAGANVGRERGALISLWYKL